MNVERTMQFILQSQARAEARNDKADARAARAEARMDRAEARMDRADARMERMEKLHDRRMAAITKLLRQGMKSIAELTEAQKAMERALKVLSFE
jgi:hypothetical protein